MESELFSIKALMRTPDRREWLQINRENESLKKDLESLKKTNQRMHLDRMNLEAEFDLKRKSLAALQSKLNDFNEVYMPRVNEVQELQQQILQELQQIRQDAELLPVMFRNEANMKTIIIEEKLEAERRMKEAVAALEEQRSNAKKYFEERNRKEKIALQAIAARNTVTAQLKETLARCQEAENVAGTLTHTNQAYEAELKDFKEQFDTLQSQVFKQNNRINELEDQKRMLIDQLKQLGGTSKVHHTHKRLNPD
jgi:chromosome segregation ATPase